MLIVVSLLVYKGGVCIRLFIPTRNGGETSGNESNEATHCQHNGDNVTHCHVEYDADSDDIVDVDDADDGHHLGDYIRDVYDDYGCVYCDVD